MTSIDQTCGESQSSVPCASDWRHPHCQDEHEQDEKGPPERQNVGIWVITRGILFWYICSMSLTAINKVLFDTMGFNYSLLVTMLHFAFMSVCLKLGFMVLPTFFPDFPQVKVTFFMKSIIPLAFLSAAEIAFSNLSYDKVSLAVMTVIKSSLVVVTYLFGVAFRLETFQWRLFGVISLIVGSICFSVHGMAIKNIFGVVFLCFAVVTAALRWVIAHHQLQRENFTPLQLMVLTQPMATVFLAPVAVIFDLPRLINEVSSKELDISRTYCVIILISVAIVLAFTLLLSEYSLVRNTSSVSLTVAGVGKEIATIIMSTTAFKEHMSLRSISGIALSVLGIIIYSRIRYSNVKKAAEGIEFAVISTQKRRSETKV